jgi:lactate dehydrogenase-like 2-hydroxyacid dehydrogenase
MEQMMFNRREFTEFLTSGLVLTSVAAPRALAKGVTLSSIKIATIGAGREGGALGTLFAKLGHPVLFSSRHPEELKDLVSAAGPTARAGTTADAVAFGDVIVLAVPMMQ